VTDAERTDRDGFGDDPEPARELPGEAELSAAQVRELMRPLVQRTRREMGFDVMPPRIRENSPYLGKFSLVDLLGIARANRAEAEAGGRGQEAALWATAERHLAGYVHFLQEMGRDPTQKIDTRKYLDRPNEAQGER